MIILRFIASLLIFIFACLPLIIIGWAIVPIMLLCGWSGYTGWWGNSRWGTGANDPAYNKSAFLATHGFLAAYNWLGWRNPINNFSGITLSLTTKPHTGYGNPLADTNTEPGFYYIKMGLAWEYLWVHNYHIFGASKCVYLRFGWKINGGAIGDAAPFACTCNPWISYSGKGA